VIRRKRETSGGGVKVTFSLPIDDPPGQVSVVGSFNDWTPGRHRLVKRAGGVRSVAVSLPAGSAVRFRYLGENGHWFDDPDADRVDAQGSQIVV
jgi:1,4-alpha-glucan branching enzyme